MKLTKQVTLNQELNLEDTVKTQQNTAFFFLIRNNDARMKLYFIRCCTLFIQSQKNKWNIWNSCQYKII